MRLTVITLALLPFAAQAQSTTEASPAPQSCAVGMVWNSAAGICTAAENQSTPMEGIPGGSNCSHGGTTGVTS